ncbi:transcriptional regulator [Escherichia coli]|uniref:helix-turn-helix domain-containing protein n=1 Tax=Edwardsiella TaxID=635 RepID=UPI00054CBA38|nr:MULTISPECIES: helix-turn-helix domain-containing protein [Edwardsiella]EFP0183606.1 transcriptional regulator [Escherichia coli]EGA8339545.1 transcriptional regulator [Salmonella enterica subsp. enterica serovar Saintpaul]EKG9744512.1 helix-turn-helix domain-containing protein [Salmonella enterica]EKS7763295.1 helix-turn-helix domain-containing protein [Edwardsiella ictaluri]EKS7789710.1 helix-turn-helix domain-containing protein [Edwardsiella ictaluri]
MSNTLVGELPSDPNEKREWIKYNLKINGMTLASLARQHQTSRQVLSRALYKQNPRWEHEIAKALGTKPTQLWPERYDVQNGMPKKETT